MTTRTGIKKADAATAEDSVVYSDDPASVGLWTNSAYYALNLSDGQVLPATTEEAHEIRKRYVKQAMEQKAGLDARTIRGRDLIDGRIPLDVIRLLTLDSSNPTGDL